MYIQSLNIIKYIHNKKHWYWLTITLKLTNIIIIIIIIAFIYTRLFRIQHSWCGRVITLRKRLAKPSPTYSTARAITMSEGKRSNDKTQTHEGKVPFFTLFCNNIKNCHPLVPKIYQKRVRSIYYSELSMLCYLPNF